MCNVASLAFSLSLYPLCRNNQRAAGVRCADRKVGRIGAGIDADRNGMLARTSHRAWRSKVRLQGPNIFLGTEIDIGWDSGFRFLIVGRESVAPCKNHRSARRPGRWSRARAVALALVIAPVGCDHGRICRNDLAIRAVTPCRIGCLALPTHYCRSVPRPLYHTLGRRRVAYAVTTILPNWLLFSR